MSERAQVAGQFSIGGEWSGLAKLAEESGELTQVLGKLIATGGEADHWDGTDLNERLVEELGDVLAAIDHFIIANRLDADAVSERRLGKRMRFNGWYEEATGRSPYPSLNGSPDPQSRGGGR